MESLRFVAFCLLVTGFQTSQGAEWTYTGEKGVDNWATLFPDYCNGMSQSPIDLDASKITYDADLEDFTFSNFDNTNGVTWILSNNGHTAQVTIGSGTMQVSGGSLGGTYQAAQFHFHWGSDSSKGSEHTVNGLSFPMEVHIVCFNTKYGSLGAALPNSDALAVLGFFFEISPNTNPTIQKLVSQLPNIKFAGNQTNMTPFPLTDMMAGMSDYFRYRGGLTTPTCNEIVTWTVFRNTIKISETQMNAFRGLMDNHDHTMVNNYRPVQALNDRTVRASFFDEAFASASGLVASSLALVASLLMSLWCRF